MGFNSGFKGLIHGARMLLSVVGGFHQLNGFQYGNCLYSGPLVIRILLRPGQLWAKYIAVFLIEINAQYIIIINY
jgi:hypothetical protein